MVSKVVHICRRLSQIEWGGIETTVLALSKELEKRGISSPIFTTSMLAKPGEEEIEGVEVRRFPYVLPWFFLSKKEKEALIKKGGSPLSFSLFFSLLFEKDVRLIHTHSLHRLGGIARTCALLRGIPYVVTLHGGYLTMPEAEKEAMKRHFRGHCEWGKIFGFLLGSRRVLHDAAAIICVGRLEYECMRKLFPKKTLFYLPNGIDLQKFQNQKRVRKKTVLCVSRMDPQKNQLALIRAFAKFSKSFPDYSCQLIGPISSPDYFEEIKKTITQLSLDDKITITTDVGYDDTRLQDAYSEASLFVLPSHHEPFGIVILEAWAMGCPVIAAKVGGIPGFTEDGKNVLLFSTEDELFEKMVALASSDELKERLSQEGIKAVQNYSWEQITNQLVAIYESL
jgi:glycosyltransferase involved in cell wall biosynthesis